jgi:hypothetical protein
MKRGTIGPLLTLKEAVRLRIRQLSISILDIARWFRGLVEAIFDMMKLKQEQITK